MSAYRRLISSVSLLAIVLLVFTSPAVAQFGAPSGAEQEIVRVSAELQIENETTGRLIVTARIADGFHIYAQTQPKPFLASKISVAESAQFRITDSFRPDTTPLVHRHDVLDVELHEFEREVNWSAPVELTRGVDVASLNVTGTVFAQACNADRCLAPKTYAFTATVVRAATPVSPPDDTQSVIATEDIIGSRVRQNAGNHGSGDAAFEETRVGERGYGLRSGRHSIDGRRQFNKAVHAGQCADAVRFRF